MNGQVCAADALATPPTASEKTTNRVSQIRRMISKYCKKDNIASTTIKKCGNSGVGGIRPSAHLQRYLYHFSARPITTAPIAEQKRIAARYQLAT